MLPSETDLESGNQEAFKRQIHLYAQEFPFLFTSPYFDQILELSRKHAPNKATQESGQYCKETIMNGPKNIGQQPFMTLIP